MHEVLVNRLGGLSLPRKSVVRLTDRPDMTLDVYRGRKTTIQPTNQYYKAFYANALLLYNSTSETEIKISPNMDSMKVIPLLKMAGTWRSYHSQYGQS